MAKKPKLHKSTEILNVCRKEIQVLVEAKFRLKVGDFLTDLHIIIHVAEINDENNTTTPVWLLNLTSRELYIQQDAIICDKFIHDVQLSTGEVKNSDFSTLLIRDVTEIDTREYKEFPEQMKDFENNAVDNTYLMTRPKRKFITLPTLWIQWCFL